MFSENYTRQTALAGAQAALDPGLTDHELAQLARSDEAKVRAAVAERTATPLTVIPCGTCTVKLLTCPCDVRM